MWAAQWVSDEVGGLPVLAGMAGASRPRAGGDVAAQAGPGPGGGQAADPRARPADEGQRHRLRRRRRPHDHLLHRRAPGRLPRAGARSLGDPARPGRAAPAVGPRRGPAHRRARLVRARAVLLDVPGRLRAGVGADGQGPGPAAEPDADLGRLRAADVLPEVRAPAVSSWPARSRPGGRARRSAAARPTRPAPGIASRGTSCPASASPARPVDAGLPATWAEPDRRRSRYAVRLPSGALPGRLPP